MRKQTGVVKWKSTSVGLTGKRRCKAAIPEVGSEAGRQVSN